MNKKQVLIAGAGTAIVGISIYLLIRKSIRENNFNQLLLVLEQMKAADAGDLGYLKAFDPNYATASEGGQVVILYKAAKVDELADKLSEAFKNRPLQFSLTDEDAIYATYQSIESQKKMAQVAKRYQEKYGESLMDRLTSELNKSERTKLFNIVKEKPLVQYQ